MNAQTVKHQQRGFVSYVMVLSVGAILTLLTLYAYNRAISAHKVQSEVQLRVDYDEREDALLRSLVSIVPNRVVRAMQNGSDANAASRDPLKWQAIMFDALTQAEARTAVSAAMKTTMGVATAVSGNSGDSSYNNYYHMFDGVTSATEGNYTTAGLNQSLGAGYPVPLSSSNNMVNSRDGIYPIISKHKIHGALAQSGVGLPVADYPQFNILPYPQINFGYARPGDPFVAKRNWWAFEIDMEEHDAIIKTNQSARERKFVLSIYEIPSQLPISASAFMSLGEFGSGEAWGDVNIEGGVFAGRAVVEGETNLDALSSRRGMTLGEDATIGGKSLGQNPFLPGERESYQVTEGDFYPVSLASESGRVAFIPISRGADFFDRFSVKEETVTVSPTTWNEYSIGALQCAMRLDIVEVVSNTNPTPTKLRFSYMKAGVRKNLDIPLNTGTVPGLPPGYIFAVKENQSYDFGTAVVDLAYGESGSYAFQTGATGLVTFNNARFGDPIVGTVKSGYYRPSYPFEIKNLPSGQICVALYPERMPAFLASLNADGTDKNHSITVNVDYTTATGSVNLTKPQIPSTELDYGVILQECADLTGFSKGFSLVSNLRLYVGDDFNIVPTTAPSGWSGAGDYFPPCSLFTPEKRYGVEIDPLAVSLGGQIGSLASESVTNPVRPLDSKTVSGSDLSADRIKVNLKPITHPGELPPIFMTNWLVMVEEVRPELVTP